MAASTHQPERPNQDDKDRFARALKRAIDKSNLKISQIVRESGLSYNSIKAYRLGKKFPLPQNATRLAETLNSQNLISLAQIKIECPVCSKLFIVGSQKPSAFCSETCYKTEYSRASKRQRKNALSRANRELKRYRESVRLHCLSCTGGEPMCQMPECDLRPVSPLPLIKVNHAKSTPPNDKPIRRVTPVPNTGIVLTRR